MEQRLFVGVIVNVSQAIRKESKFVNRSLVFVLAILFLLSSCAAPETNGVEVRDAWMRPVAQRGIGAVYFVIRSSEEDELVKVSSGVAEAVEMHESKMNGNVMEMHQLESVPLGAGEQVQFQPGGLHIMLIGVKEDLKIGDEIEIILHFKNSPDINVTVPVTDSPASG